MMDTPLNRCLSWPELTFFGMGQMIGAGIFVLSGTLIKEIAGPAGAISYLLAGSSAIFAALCYAELSTRLPKAGSCYTFTYFSLGELIGFLVGWTMLLDLIIGLASVSKAFSGALNSLVNNAIRNTTMGIFGKWDTPITVLDETPDIIALIMIIIDVIIINFGAKSSLVLNMGITVIEVLCLIFITIFCFVYGSFDNWASTGGFMPYGVQGVFAGASIAVFAFCGFDGIANAAEETLNPRNALPLAICLALGITAVIYISATLGLSVLVPRTQLDLAAPFVKGFETVNQNWLKYIAAVGTLCATASTMIASSFIIPRMLYAMGSDNLIFPIFAKVWDRTKVPVFSLIIGASIAAVLAIFIKIDVLAEIVSLGSLIAYADAGICLILIRYKNLETTSNDNILTDDQDSYDEIDHTIPPTYPRIKESWQRAWVFGRSDKDLYLILYIMLIVLISCIIIGGEVTMLWANFPSLITTLLFIIILTICLIVIAIIIVLLCFYDLPEPDPKREKQIFSTPLMPVVPLAAIIINVTLLLTLQFWTWIRFSIWTIIG